MSKAKVQNRPTQTLIFRKNLFASDVDYSCRSEKNMQMYW